MRCRCAVAVALVGMIAALPAADAQAQNNGIPCDAFVKNSDGSWTAMRDASIDGTGGKLTVRQGSALQPGATIRGLDLTTMLDRDCAAASPPVTTPGPPAAPAPASAPVAALGRYADANGSIDVQTLTCGQLADTSPEEANLFLAWYSGWYNGQAKHRGINLARVRYAIRNVVDYCRGNRDKRIVQVMDLMLK